jgi:H2-forming N5,N10-methylenetetrahydromethanopterin dehydrogenase-like enzyme
MGYVSVPTDYGDDDPAHEVFMISVHLFAPLGKDTVKMRQEIKRRLHEAGTTWPTCTNASDKEGQHHVFECEIAQEVGAE